MLGIYKYPDGGGAISFDESFTNPIAWGASNFGATIEQMFYLRMESPTAEYLTDGTLYCADIDDGVDAGWVQFALDISGVPDTYSSTLDFELAIEEQIAFWIKIEIPASWSVGNPKDDLRVACNYIRHII